MLAEDTQENPALGADSRPDLCPEPALNLPLTLD